MKTLNFTLIQTGPLAAVVAGLLVLSASSARAQYFGVWYDGYAVSANSHDVNFEYNSTARQGGVLKPIDYAQSPAGNNYRHQLKGQTGDRLQLAGDSGGIGEASPNYNFTNTVNGGQVGRIFFQMRIGATINTPTNYVWAAFTLGANTPLVGFNSNAVHFGVSFIHDTLFGNGNYMQFFDGNTLVANLIPFPAGVTPTNQNEVTLFVSDPTDDNPWNGVGSTVIRLHINDQYVAGYTKTGGGYTNNYLTMQGAANNTTPSTKVLAINYFDELTLSTAPPGLYKADNTENLNLTTSWSGGVVPGGASIAQWDSTVTAANSTALGADLSFGGLKITDPGGAITISSGNALTLGRLGVDMSGASQNLTISSGLTLGVGQQTWAVNTGRTLTQNTGTFAGGAGATLLIDKTFVTGTVTASPTLVNSVLPWAVVRSGGVAAAGSANGHTFATVSGGNVVAYTGATAATTGGTTTWGGIPSGGTGLINYDVSLGTPNSTGANRNINTLRYIGGAAAQDGNSAATLLNVNCILNAGTGTLTLGSGGAAGMGISSSSSANELVLAAANAGISFGINSVITNNGANATAVTVTGPNAVTMSGANTYSGATTVGSGTLALSGSGSISSSSAIIIAGGARFDVFGLSSTFNLGGSQTLSNAAWGTGSIRGSLNSGSGTISLNYADGIQSLSMIAGTMTLSSGTTFKINNVGNALPPGTYQIVTAAGGTVAGTLPSVTLTGSWPSGGTPALSLSGGNLNLTVGGNSAWSYTGSSFTYNGAAQGPTISLSGSTGVKTTNYVGTGATVYSSTQPPINAGTYYVSNTVAADANYFGTTNTQSFTIAKATPAFTLSSSANPAGYLDGLTFTASGFAADVTGSVQFTTNSVDFGGAVTISGQAALSSATTYLPRGTVTVDAAYSGNDNYLPATNNLTQTVTNHPPLAKAITNGLPAGVTSSIRVIGGKPGIVPTDADGDALLVSSVQNPSALLSATVTTDGTNILYTPGLNASGADTVEYVVSDGFGGYGTNTMYVAVSGQSFNIISGPTLVNNEFQVTFAGISNFTYTVDDSTNSVSGPWAFLTNLTAGTNGLFQLVVTNDPPTGQRFFRTRAQLP